MRKDKPLKILIIRFSSIGDIILTTPVIRCLKIQTDAEIHFLTKKSFAGLLITNIYLTKIHELDESLSDLIAELKKEKFDLIIDLHKNLRSLLIKINIGVKSNSFDKLNFLKWLLVNFKINKMPEIHIVDRYLNNLKSLSIVNDEKGLDFFIPNDISLPNDLIIHKNSEYFVFAIGAQHATKRLPENKIIDICNQLKYPVYLIGGKEENLVGENVSNQSLNTINTCGKLSIMQSALLMRNAKLILTHDTGMMHIAAALKKKIISIWGNTVPEFGMTPYKTEHILQSEVLNLPCRPCSKIGFDECPKRHFNCMNQQNTNLIITKANQN